MRLLLLFASQPLFSDVLPSLQPPLLPFQAALLYHAMLRDQLIAASDVEGLKVRICFAEGLLPGSFEGDLGWEKQRGETREQKLSFAVASAFKAGATRVMVTGLDSTLLPAPVLRSGFEALKSNALVAGKGIIGFSRALPLLYALDRKLAIPSAKAFGLPAAAIRGGMVFENLSDLSDMLKKRPELAPLSAMTLASIA